LLRSAKQIQKKDLTLKQLKDTIYEMVASKQKHDVSQMQLGRPQDTMSAHMFTYLNQRYGLKQICIEQAKLILKALQQFMNDDPDVTLFAKILDHKVDEQFWHV